MHGPLLIVYKLRSDKMMMMMMMSLQDLTSEMFKVRFRSRVVH